MKKYVLREATSEISIYGFGYKKAGGDLEEARRIDESRRGDGAFSDAVENFYESEEELNEAFEKAKKNLEAPYYNPVLHIYIVSGVEKQIYEEDEDGEFLDEIEQAEAWNCERERDERDEEEDEDSI